MEACRLSFPCSIATSPRSLRSPNFRPYLNPNFSSRVRCSSAKYRRRSRPQWDSNAESLRTEGFKFNFGEESPDDDDDDEYDDDTKFRRRRKQRSWWSDRSSDVDEGSGILEDVIDSVWIFKVFRSFGWMLPFVIASMLLATGPKAFLMALALPLGQSALSLAVDKVWGSMRESPKPRSRTKKKPFGRATRNVTMNEEEQESRETRKGGVSYQSWVAADDGSLGKDGQRMTSFGGWDELDKQGDTDKQSKRKQPRTTDWGRRQQVEKKGKLSRRVRNRDTPLLLRLLIAVFPILGSWTKMLW